MQEPTRNVAPLSPEQQQIHSRLVVELPFFARKTLWLKTKDPNNPIAKLEFNFVQMYIHERVEAHLAKYGRVRVIVIKGRQQGASTYITARFYHKSVMKKASSVYILSHEAESTAILFDKVYTYYTGSVEHIKPELDADNAKSLGLRNGSTYSVGTAKAKGTGRSGTNLYFHGSEPAHYPDGENVQSGALQTVPSGAGSEVFLETTCNGMNWFYDFTQDARNGENPYEVIFVPWYWSPEYRSPVPTHFKRTDDEQKLVQSYKLDNEQLQWRREKIGELRSKKDVTNPERLFKQEYPFTIEEAFQSSGESLFDSATLNMARKCDVTDYDSPVVVGCDPSRLRDRFVTVSRRGREFFDKEVKPGMQVDEAVDYLIAYCKRVKADKLFIDRGHYGIAIVDKLVKMGWGWLVEGVDFGQKPTDAAYANKRTEMYMRFHKWTEDYPCKIFDDEETNRDMLAIPPTKVDISGGTIGLPSKESIKETLKRSPDIADSMCLTFAFEVARTTNIKVNSTGVRVSPSALSSSRVVDTVYGNNEVVSPNQHNLRGLQVKSQALRPERDW